MNTKSILIVDDSSFDREILRNALGNNQNFTLFEASSREECFAILTQEKINLVLLDIMLAKENGKEVLSEIRAKFSPLDLPVIMATSKTETASIVDCLQRGANDYITKPVNFDIVLSRLSTHLQLSEMSQEMSQLREQLAIHATVRIYNEEINAPLNAALECLKKIQVQQSPAHLDLLRNSLYRIADHMKKISSLAQQIPETSSFDRFFSKPK